MNKPEWLPNWKNVSEYPDPVTTTSQQWAWEFLRRNASYQADYEEIILFQETHDPDLNERAQEVMNSFFGIIDFSNIGNTVSSVLGSRLLPAMHRSKKDYPWIPKACWRLVTKYNLYSPVDPSRPSADGFFIENNQPYIETKTLFANPRSIPDTQKITIIIDLGWNLSDQLKYIQGFLEAYPRNKERTRKIGYLECIRLLDGKASGATWNSIAKELGNKTRAAYDKIAKKAELYLNDKFFDLSKSNLVPGEGNMLKLGKKHGETFFFMNATEPSLRKALCGNNCISSEGFDVYIKPKNEPTP